MDSEDTLLIKNTFCKI